ncbi:MAG: hypothetical protein JKY94_13265 [Rhodobacteraceae bacterium]|nr:hypothetical protein [Paracoccaceae bacterium]
MKPRINIYLDDHVAAQLTLLSKRPGLNKSRIVNDALDRFFNPERDQTFEKAMLRRLDHMSKSQAKIERNESIATETLALFVRYFLTITPPLPQAEQAAAHALGKERFEVFVAQVGRRLAQDQSLLNEVLARIADNRPDLFTSPSSRDSTDNLSDDLDGTADATESTAKGQKSDDGPPMAEPEDSLPPLRPVVIVEDDDDDMTNFEEQEVSWYEVPEEEDDV